MTDPTKRFSSRVENYIRYRPGYPVAVIELLRERCGFGRTSIVADIGCGTGIFTELLLKSGSSVLAVEPNTEMRQAAERLLAIFPGFKSVWGTAEATTLPDHSVSHITAVQAFHWFDRAKARQEFLRILQPRGWVALIWNDRKVDSPFLTDYEEFLLRYGTDYATVNHRQIDSTVIGSFFKPNGFQQTIFPNEQVFDFEGLKGRLLSSSYVPDAGHPRFDPMLEELRAIFEKHQRNGTVVFSYDTSVFYGQLAPIS